MKMIVQFLDLLSVRERKSAGLLSGMILLMAFLDMTGIASIMPFMAVLSDPKILETNAFIKKAYSVSNSFGIDTTEKFLLLLGSLVFFLLVTSLSFKALTTYAQLRFGLMREYTISKRLIEGYLHQPYSWFLSRHSADLGKAILSEVGIVIQGGMIPMMNLIAQATVSITLLTLLIIIDPKLALVAGLSVTSAYMLIFWVTKSLLLRIGKERVKANQARFNAVIEAFGAFKEVKVGGLEQAYIRRFSNPSRIYARHDATAQVIGQLPRFALEAIGFGGMLLMTMYLLANNGGVSSALPTIALYAFAGYRLLPALQQIYGAITQLRFVGPALESLHKEVCNASAPKAHADEFNSLLFTESIRLDKVTYRYSDAKQPALESINFTISAGSKVGIVGATGSGKTTAVDVILGLLEPQEGSLWIDSKEITAANRREWQRTIGYVPQQIFLADDSIAANIAFGISPDEIDLQAVKRAAKIANLHEFVIKDLLEGYDTKVGERGVRLSGGQRQRIGIARALYHKPQVLILDEATSALDNLTEKLVMEAFRNLGRDVTIIIIAHRLSTVRECDHIYFMERGKVRSSGTFNELIENDPVFRRMADR